MSLVSSRGAVADRIARINAYAMSAPIARWLGVSVALAGEDLIHRLSFSESHIGNPAIRAIHGGVIAAFLEFAMQSEMHAECGAPVSTVSLSIDYLSSSRAADMACRVKVLRKGRRVSFLEANGWQGDESILVASARGCFRIG